MRHFLKIILGIFTPLRLIILLGVGIFLAFLILGDQGVLQLNKLLVMKNDLTRQRDDLNADIERLTKEKELLHNPRNLELVIRKELGFIKPGEIVYQIKDKEEE
jgi:cell division protein FtsB